MELPKGFIRMTNNNYKNIKPGMIIAYYDNYCSHSFCFGKVHHIEKREYEYFYYSSWNDDFLSLLKIKVTTENSTTHMPYSIHSNDNNDLCFLGNFLKLEDFKEEF